jgi:hypothetical protein
MLPFLKKPILPIFLNLGPGNNISLKDAKAQINLCDPE